MRKNTRFGIYVVASILAFSGVAYLSAPKSNYSYLDTSFLHVVEKIAGERKVTNINLEIKEIKLNKIANPKDYFNFYEYEAEVVVANLGDDLEKGEVVVEAKSQESKNLSLSNFASGAETTINGYKILINGDLNRGVLEFALKVDGEILDTSEVEIFEKDPGIEIDIRQILSKGPIEGVQIMFKENLLVREVQYKEESIEGEVISYEIVPSSNAILKENFREIFEYDGKSGFVYLKKVDPETGFESFSDVIHVFENEPLTRAAFAKIFVERAGIELDQEGLNFYEDVDKNEWYAPYVNTLYGLGLLDSKIYFFPAETISRGEVLRMVMDYFDSSFILRAAEEGKFFEDVESKDALYPYLYSLYASGKGQAFDETFEPNKPATKEFLNYLINAYK